MMESRSVVEEVAKFSPGPEPNNPQNTPPGDPRYAKGPDHPLRNNPPSPPDSELEVDM
jgi:hypothetical protein